MRRFLKYLLLLLLVTCILMFSLDKLYTAAYKHLGSSNKVQYILNLENKNYDLAFFGSSRTENHIDCDLISKLTGKTCVNFGFSGGTAADMLDLMKVLKSHNVNFESVFMQVDYGYNNVENSNYFKASAMPFNENEILRNRVDNANNTDYLVELPFYRFMANDKIIGFRAIMRMVFQTKMSTGFVPKEGNELKTYGEFPLQIIEENPEINKMILLYKRSETNLKFFTAPYCPKIKNRFVVDSIAVKFNEFHNYIYLFDDKEEYFFNCGHLNKKGAEMFTRTLAEDLIR